MSSLSLGFHFIKEEEQQQNSCVCFYGPVFHAIFAVFYLPSQVSVFILKQKTNFMCWEHAFLKTPLVHTEGYEGNSLLSGQ